MIKKLYKSFEEKYSGALRVFLVLATLGTLLFAAYTSLDGLIKTRATADKEDQVDAVAFSVVEDLLFQKQIEVLEEKEVEEEVEEVPEKIKAIHASMAKHFKDGIANKEQFAEMLKPITLKGILELMKAGNWRIGNNMAGWQVDIPDNDWDGCFESRLYPALTDDQHNQLIDHMARFWKSAEKGTDTDSGTFARTEDFNGRLGQVIAANDLLLCSFHDSLQSLKAMNAEREAEAEAKQMIGMAKIGVAGVALEALFKFFAMLAAVVIALMLYRIQQTIRRND